MRYYAGTPNPDYSRCVLVLKAMVLRCFEDPHMSQKSAATAVRLPDPGV